MKHDQGRCTCVFTSIVVLKFQTEVLLKASKPVTSIPL